MSVRLKTLERLVLRDQVREAGFSESIQGLTGLRSFLQSQIQRRGPGIKSVGHALCDEIRAAWARSDVATLLQVLPFVRRVLTPNRPLAVRWKVERYVNWEPDEAALRALDIVSHRADVIALREEHPGINRLIHFLWDMAGPACDYRWHDATQPAFEEVTLGAHAQNAYATQAAHIAATLPDRDEVVVVMMQEHAEAVVHGNTGARVGPALGFLSAQITMALVTLVARWPEEVANILNAMNTGACLDGQTMACQQVLEELQNAGVVAPELPDGLGLETYIERCCMSFKTEASARWCRKHGLAQSHDPGTFVDDARFKETYYSAPLLLAWMQDKGYAQTWQPADLAVGIAHLQALCMLPDDDEA